MASVSSSSSSSSRTLTLEQSPLFLILQRKDKILDTKDKTSEVRSLINRMLQSPLLDQQFLVRWLEAFLRYPIDTEAGKKRAARALCHLLMEHVNPAISYGNEADGLIQFQEDIQKLMQELLPQGTAVEQFLKQYEDGFQEMAKVSSAFQMIAASKEAQRALMYQKANAAQRSIAANYASSRNRLIEMDTLKKEKTEQMCAQLKAIEKENNELNTERGRIADDLHNASNAMIAQINDHQRMLSEAQKEVNKG